MRWVIMILAGVLIVAPTNAQYSAFRVAQVFDSITAESPPGDHDRLFIVGRSGGIFVLHLATGLLEPSPFIQVAGVHNSGERGLLGLAFHPQFNTSGLFYVHFQDFSGATNIVEYHVPAATPNQADPLSRRVIWQFSRMNAGNHNGGWAGFGRDGFLYLSSGDAGQNAQSTANLFGKILRIDPGGDDFETDALRNYRIPPSNPFSGVGDARPEIWSLGLRNPYRCSFDRSNRDLWIADVGASTWEEVNRQLGSSAGGENYGWPCREGPTCVMSSCCQNPAFTAPHIALSRSAGCAIIGGYVYRGSRIGALRGLYIQSDYCVSGVFAIDPITAQRTLIVNAPSRVLGFGQDGHGEVYICCQNGVYRITSGAAPPDCDGDGRTDEQEIFEDGAPDDDLDGVPDSCDALCPCDWNGSGDLSHQDYLDFMEAFFDGAGDFNQSGETDSQDYFDFAECMFSACRS